MPEYVEWRTFNITLGPIHQLLNSDLSARNGDIQKFKHIGWCTTYFDAIVITYAGSKDEIRQDFLATIYREITGNEIEDRQRLIID